MKGVDDTLLSDTLQSIGLEESASGRTKVWLRKNSWTCVDIREDHEQWKRFVVYYEGIKQEIKRKPIYECQCDERLKTKAAGPTRPYHPYIQYVFVCGSHTHT
jgi:hypothetical protein